MQAVRGVQRMRLGFVKPLLGEPAAYRLEQAMRRYQAAADELRAEYLSLQARGEQVLAASPRMVLRPRGTSQEHKFNVAYERLRGIDPAAAERFSALARDVMVSRMRARQLEQYAQALHDAHWTRQADGSYTRADMVSDLL